MRDNVQVFATCGPVVPGRQHVLQLVPDMWYNLPEGVPPLVVFGERPRHHAELGVELLDPLLRMPDKVGDKLQKNKQDGRKCRSTYNLVHDCCSSLAHLCPYPCRSVLLYVFSAVHFEPYPIQEAGVGNKTLLFDPSLLCFKTFLMCQCSDHSQAACTAPCWLIERS